ncbi:3-methyladenine DNA glycosylase [Sanguibacter suaedae]|uniref:3-methyladenine DNA glycosylase n=1 Tax=Sanguibacter suaedae TaxID=2795737 RepID=A0A934I586_9MICO|nr:3-methyladenine DNA glycosylase [Sanguibacter suaedae]MBI9114481.1 3-methyladenine DNA glycosylase [Sanguibacter suaedae]
MTSSTGTADHPEVVAVDRPGGVDDSPGTLEPARWVSLADLHAARADALTRGWRERRGTGVEHQIEDFLHTYYPARPAQLRRWHPGAGVTLASAPDVPGAAERSTWRWYVVSDTGATLDVAAFLADRGDTVAYVRDLLVSTASRPAALGCFGLHEWAMVYRQGGDTRHSLPLRLGPEGTDAVVEAHPVRCTHIDAFRFFTPEARPLNQLQPTRDTQRDLEQPGCLHAGMDLVRSQTCSSARTEAGRMRQPVKACA